MKTREQIEAELRPHGQEQLARKIPTYSWPSVARSLAEELQRALEVSRDTGPPGAG